MSVEDLVAGWRVMDTALAAYEAAEDAVDGYVDEMFPDQRIAEKLEPMADRYRFPLDAIPVDVLSDRCEVTGFSSPVPGVNERIAAIEKANRLDVQYPDLIRKAFTYGDAYMLTLDVDDVPAGRSLTARRLAAARAEVSVHGPKHVRMFYDTETETTPTHVIKRWCRETPDGKVWRGDIYYPDRVERWVTKPGEAPDDVASWKARHDADITDADSEADDGTQRGHILATPTGDQLPWTHFRTGLPYGSPVHERGYGCQSALTKMLVTQLDTTDSHGWPQRYRLIEMGAELDSAHDDPDWNDDADAADSGNVQGGVASGRRVGPGTMLELTGTASVGQFSAADPGVFMDPAKVYIRLMALLTHTPMHYFDPTGDAPSGESYRVADMPLKRRADRMITILTGSFEEFWDYTLRVAGVDLADGNVVVGWAPTGTASGLTDWQEVRERQDAGVPIPVTLIDAGFPADLVETWNLPEHPADFGGETGTPPAPPALPPAPVPDDEPAPVTGG